MIGRTFTRRVLPLLLLPSLWAAGAAEPGQSALPPGEPLVGVITAVESVDVTACVEGQVKELKVKMGERIAAGQVLLHLDAERFRLEVAARNAFVQSIDSELRSAGAQLVQAKQRLEREKQLAAYSSVENAEAAESSVLQASATVDMIQARRAEAAARLALATYDLECTRVRAPFAGRITERYQMPGAVVGRTSPLVRLVSEQVRLRFAVPETQLALVRAGTALQVHLPVLGVTLPAKVDGIAPEVDASTRHLKAEATLVVPDALKDKVAAGLLADVRITTSATSRATP